MMLRRLLVSCFALVVLVEGGSNPANSSLPCDDGVHGIEIDFPSDDQDYYKCQSYSWLAARKMSSGRNVHYNETARPIHQCLSVPIVYENKPPTSGYHRKLWPAYGEYTYCPPQRWMHNLEHGAIVFLYHPCAPAYEVFLLREIAKSCLRRHIITPYLGLKEDEPLALVAWNYVRFMSWVNITESVLWIQAHALQTYEKMVYQNGKYTHWLTERAQVVNGSDIRDSLLCPEKLISLLHRNYTAVTDSYSDNAAVAHDDNDNTAVMQSDNNSTTISSMTVSNTTVSNTTVPNTTVPISKAMWGLGSIVFIVLCIIVAVLVARPKRVDKYKVRFSKFTSSMSDSHVPVTRLEVSAPESIGLLKREESDDTEED